MRYVVTILLTCLCFLLKAQNGASDNKFQLVFEKVYLHTDRGMYLQGDTLWFKAYLVNGQENTINSSSANLYVDLIAEDASIVASELIRLKGGLGAGEIEITDSLPGGRYRLRAYTNWMRNFGDNFIFEKVVTVVERITQSTDKTKASINRERVAPAQVQQPVNMPVQPVVRFCPESGSLIENIGARIAVKAQEKSGRGIKVKGAVVSSLGDTVARFSCDSLGMGLFTLYPMAGEAYRAKITTARSTFFVELPKALQSGESLQISQSDSILHAVISISENKLKQAPAKYTLTVKHAGRMIISEVLQPQVPQTRVKIATSSLPQGVSAVTLYNDSGRPSCERLVYIDHKAPHPIQVSTYKPVYKQGEKIEIRLTTQDKANLSVAVTDAETVADQPLNILSYLMLQSEVKGTIEHASTYFDTTNVNRLKQLDLLLMTQGWRDFVWRRLADTAIRISYPTEKGIIIAGAVKNELNNKTSEGVHVSLYVSAAKGSKLLSANTDSTGRFSFRDLEFYGKQPVKLAALNNKGKKTGTIYLDSINTLPAKRAEVFHRREADSSTNIQVGNVLKRKSESVKINGQNVLKEVKIKARSRGIILTNGVFTSWGADQVFAIKPQDKQYKTLEWYLLQHAKGAQKSPIKDTTGIVFLGSDTLLFRSLRGWEYRTKTKFLSPQFFINDRELFAETNDVAETYRNIYYNLPIEKIKKVVLKRVVGTITKSNFKEHFPFESEDPSPSRVSVDRYLLYLTLTDDALLGFNHGSLDIGLQGYHESRTFYKPLSGEEAAKTGYRPTLYWEPNLKTEQSKESFLQFYNTYGGGKLRIVVEGLLENGRPVYDVQTLEVEK